MIKAEDNIIGFFDETLRKLLTAKLQPLATITTGMTPRGSLPNPLRCILFDIYGTLLISASGDIGITRKSAHCSEEFQMLLDRFGVTKAPKKLLEAFFNKINAAHQEAKKKGIDYPEVQIDQIWAQVLEDKDMPRVRRFAFEFEIMANPVWPMPHLEALLSSCRKAGLPMGIISNAQFYTPLLLRWFLKTDPTNIGFIKDLLIYSFEVGCAKPSPRLFNLAASWLKKTRIPLESILYVGNDVRKDILPAKQAGFQTALFAGDARSLRLGGEATAHRLANADMIITDLNQLRPHIIGHTD